MIIKLPIIMMLIMVMLKLVTTSSLSPRKQSITQLCICSVICLYCNKKVFSWSRNKNLTHPGQCGRPEVLSIKDAWIRLLRRIVVALLHLLLEHGNLGLDGLR